MSDTPAPRSDETAATKLTATGREKSMTTLSDQIDKLLASEPEWEPEPVRGPITGKLWPGVSSIPGASLNAEEAKGVCRRHNTTRRKLVALGEALKYAIGHLPANYTTARIVMADKIAEAMKE